MRFSVLASGSGGNACYVDTTQTRILIDAGLSCRELIKRLNTIDTGSARIDGIVITHEHADHIKGVGPIARHFDIPVYINTPTLGKSVKRLGNISQQKIIQTGQAITINDICIETFSKCHDAADPMGIIVSSNGSRLGIVTDLGRSTRLVEDRLKKCTGLIIEFNHDSEMLAQGPYSVSLQRRIKGAEGHLSNQQAGELLRKVSHKSLSYVVLAHLSSENNLPEKALQVARNVIDECRLDKTEIQISCQDIPMQLMEI